MTHLPTITAGEGATVACWVDLPQARALLASCAKRPPYSSPCFRYYAQTRDECWVYAGDRVDALREIARKHNEAVLAATEAQYFALKDAGKSEDEAAAVYDDQPARLGPKVDDAIHAAITAQRIRDDRYRDLRRAMIHRTIDRGMAPHNQRQAERWASEDAALASIAGRE